MKKRLQDYKTYLINTKCSLNYYNMCKVLFDYLDKKEIKFEEFTKEQLAQFFKDKNYKSESINSVIKSGRNFCRFLNIEKSPFFEIKLLEVEKRLPEYLTLEEIEKAIKYISTYNSRISSQKTEIILYLMFYMGLRKSELLGLKRIDFDLTNCEVKIYEKKTKQEKIIYFPDKLIKKITYYFNSEEEKRNAFNITEGQLNYLFGGIMSKHLGRKIKPHLTRHGGARYMLEKGIPATVVQRILGHKNILTTLKYLEPDQKMIERLYKEKIK